MDRTKYLLKLKYKLVKMLSYNPDWDNFKISEEIIQILDNDGVSPYETTRDIIVDILKLIKESILDDINLDIDYRVIDIINDYTDTISKTTVEKLRDYFN